MPDPVPESTPNENGDAPIEALRAAVLRLAQPRLANIQAEMDALRVELAKLGDASESGDTTLHTQLENLQQTLQETQLKLNQLTDALDTTETTLNDPDAVSERLRPVLLPTLSQQIRGDLEEASRAVAPVIGPAIRQQIRDNPEELIDSLYPIIGQIIARSIRESLADLQRNIDAQLRRQIGIRSIFERFGQRIRGVSNSENILRNALPYQVQCAFLIHRKTGLLLASAANDPEYLDDLDLISGMLTAISDFARDSFGDGDDQLEAIQQGDQHILLEAGQHAYLAVVLDGIEPSGYDALMRETIIKLNVQHESILNKFNGDMGTLPDFIPSLEPLLHPTPEALGTEDTPSEKSRGQQLAIRAGIGGLLFVLVLLIFGCIFVYRLLPVAFPSAPTITPSPTPTLTFTPTASPTLTPTPTFTASPTTTASPTPSQTPTRTSSPTLQPPPEIPTQTPFPTLPVGIVDGNLNVRAAPQNTASIIGGIFAGDRVVVLGTAGDWYFIASPDEDNPIVEGWVWSEFVRFRP
jgi:hypothetical protein